MFCGCQGKKKAQQNNEEQSIDSPLQIRLIKTLGLKNFMLEKFVFRRKTPTYSIKNVKGSNIIYVDGNHYFPPDMYQSTVEILETAEHSIPVIRLKPILMKKDQKIPCIIYVHGNSSDLGDSLRFVTNMALHFKAEYITFDYTGYGQSRKPHVGEQIICKDLEIVLAWAKRSLDNIILWGFSLGTYPVIHNAAHHKVKAIILQCPIGSLACMFYDEYSSNVKFKEDHFANIDNIAKVSAKIFMMHSTVDEIIPIEQARLLYRKYVDKNGDQDIEFIEVEKIKHNSFHRYIISHNSNDLQREVLNFLKQNTNQMTIIEDTEESSMELSQQKEITSFTLLQISQGITLAKLQEQQHEEEFFQLRPSEQTSRFSRKTSNQYPDWMCCKK